MITYIDSIEKSRYSAKQNKPCNTNEADKT